MILEIIIGILGLIVAILGYATFNLLQKNEKAEDIIVSYRDFILKFQDTIDKTQKRLTQIDEKGMFKSDDEIGWFFNEIKRLQKQLNSFNIDL
tara:strand:- start:62 stop:340 length:279 start_codon:yes stop_codon:yes gene_type:complete